MKNDTIEFWQELRKGISYGVALSNVKSDELDLATDNAFRTVHRELFGKSVEEIDQLLKTIKQ